MFLVQLRLGISSIWDLIRAPFGTLWLFSLALEKNAPNNKPENKKFENNFVEQVLLKREYGYRGSFWALTAQCLTHQTAAVRTYMGYDGAHPPTAASARGCCRSRRSSHSRHVHAEVWARALPPDHQMDRPADRLAAVAAQAVREICACSAWLCLPASNM